MKRIFLYGLACAWFLVPAVAHASALLKLSVLYMNDVHGHYAPYKDTDVSGLIGGFGKTRTLIREIEKRNRTEAREALILFAGDLLTGTPFSTAWKGELGVKLMNRIGFAAMAVGNHDFDYGTENLLGKLRPMMRFPLLSANITNEAGKDLFDPGVVIRYSPDGTRVVVFGLTSERTPVTTYPGNVKGLLFPAAVKTAKEFLEGYTDKDLVIALTHLGVREDKKLAQACPGIDVIVGGHSHTALFKPLKVRNTLIVQAGAYAKYLGRLDLDVKDGRVVKHAGELILLTADIKEDPAVSAIINEYRSRMGSRLDQVIGRTEVFLDGSLRSVRSGKDTNLGKLIAFAAAQAARTRVALINGGSIRESLHKGDITLNDIGTVLPFSNHLVKMDLKGRDLLAVLQRSADLEIGDGGKLQTLGVTYTSEAGKVKIEKIAGEDFDPEETYPVATSDFLAAGGDGYRILKREGINSHRYPNSISDLVVELIKSKKVITPQILQDFK